MIPRPTAVDCTGDGRVRIAWADGRVDEHTARELRLACPCARCVHELTGRKLLDPATVPADLHAQAWRRVGSYALQFVWSDGHQTGLYTYERLRAAGEI